MSKQLRKKKPHRTPQYSSKKTWSLIRTMGDGCGYWRCKQTGKVELMKIAQRIFVPGLGKRIDYMSMAAYKYFWRSTL